jgi:hypothetical protein
MHKLIWISLSIFIFIITAFCIMSFASKDIETPEYKVIRVIENVEIRMYPKLIVAKTELSDKSFDTQGSYGFRTIANYIFGGNDKSEKIAMTAPVVMNLGDSASMYFVMPKNYDKSSLPTPNSGKVKITEEKERYLAVITFGGYTNDDKIEKYINQLNRILKKNNIQSTANFLYMGYNAPWDIFNRRNEVAVEVLI